MKYLLACLITLIIAPVALAQTTLLPGKVAVHIAERHYKHPVRMLHPFYDHWHTSGPMAEKVALNVLRKRFAEVTWCNEAKNAEVLIVLEPDMFYNAQMRQFHAEFVARVFTQKPGATTTEPAILRVRTRARVNGELSSTPDFFMERAYNSAMEKLITELETNKAFLSNLNVSEPRNAESLCPALDADAMGRRFF